jgi:L-fuculose-phosphate aldolase
MNRRPGEAALRREMVEIGRRLYERRLVCATEGNLSVRLGPERFLTTPSGACKADLGPADLVVVDGTGRVVRGAGRPSSELPLHLRAYAERPDVGAVVHAHPPTANGFAVAGLPLTRPTLAEIVYALGEVPLAEYATPTTPDLARRAAKYLRDHDAVLLANHGAISVGSDLRDAFYKMEMVEHLAHVTLVATLLGGEREIGEAEVAKLQAMRGRRG